MGNKMGKQTKAEARVKADGKVGKRVSAKVAQPQRRHVVLEATNRVKSKAAVNVTKGLRD